MDFTEINKLHEMLTKAKIPHIFKPLYDGFQIRVYSDETHIFELDDAILHGGSLGHQNGLLETYALSGCKGWETAEQVFDGWLKMYRDANRK